MKKKVFGIGITILVLAISVIGSALSLVASDTTPSVVTNPGATPSSIPADGVTTSRLNVTVTDDVEVDNVTVDLTDIGGEVTFMPLLGGDFYSVQTVAAEGTTPGTYSLKVNATDINGKYNDTVSITLEVTATTGDININEIMYAPTDTWGSKYNEWIELYNNDTKAINIGGWSIDEKEIPEAIMLRGDYLIIARMKETFNEYYPDVTCSVIEVKISLKDTGETIMLNDTTPETIDSVDYTEYASGGLEWGYKDNKTLELNETGGWEQSFVDGGTPGEVNSVSVTDWNPWDDDCVISDVEISMAEWHWATSTPKNGHTITDAEISLLEYQWATGDVC